MPEGPSIIIVKEAVKSFAGKKIIVVEGNTKIDKERLLDKKIIAFRTWGKHFLICFKGFSLRVHFLMFGTYRVNERKTSQARLSLGFKNGELNLYSCSIQFLEGDIDEHYDWTGDVMNEDWNADSALKKLKKNSETLICEALLDQNIFAGVGNIIKNEVLYRVKVHPASKSGKIPAKKRREIVNESRTYSFQFLEWKRLFELKKHWLAHTKRQCLRCELPMSKNYFGKTKRRSFYCTACQVLYE